MNKEESLKFLNKCLSEIESMSQEEIHKRDIEIFNERSKTALAYIDNPYSDEFWKKVNQSIHDEHIRFEEEEKLMQPTHEQMNKRFDI